MSWRRLAVLVRNLPPSSRLGHAQHGDIVRWGDSEHILAGIYDLLAGGNWQRGGGKGRRPVPMKRPGDKGTTRYGKVVSLSEARRRLREATGIGA